MIIFFLTEFLKNWPDIGEWFMGEADSRYSLCWCINAKIIAKRPFEYTLPIRLAERLILYKPDAFHELNRAGKLIHIKKAFTQFDFRVKMLVQEGEQSTFFLKI